MRCSSEVNLLLVDTLGLSQGQEHEPPSCVCNLYCYINLVLPLAQNPVFSQSGINFLEQNSSERNLRRPAGTVSSKNKASTSSLLLRQRATTFHYFSVSQPRCLKPRSSRTRTSRHIARRRCACASPEGDGAGY